MLVMQHMTSDTTSSEFDLAPDGNAFLGLMVVVAFYAVVALVIAGVVVI